MKKGLLTILAAALTIVSCQNYDDQFAELTGLVTTLSTQVAGITEVKNSITTLSQTVTGLKSSLDTSIPGLSTSLDSALEDIATLEGLLADVASEGDLDAITDALALVQADVKELLQADAVINQNITINNAATLEYVSSLISSGPDDPSVIVNGRVTIATALLTPAEVVSTSLIASKLRTVLGNGAATAGDGVSITSTYVLDLSKLAFVDDDVTISGGKQNIAGLKTISGNFNLDYGKLAETLDLSDLTSIGGDITIAASTANSATAVDFGTLDVSGYVETGAAGSKTNSFPNALTIDTSNAGYIGMDADKATSIASSMDGVTPVVASMTIGATNGGTIDMNSLTQTAAFVLTGATTTVAHFDKLKTSGALTVNSAGEAHFGVLKTIATVDATATAALNFNGVTAIGAAFTATAPLVLVSSLATVTFASTISMNELSIPSLKSVTAILTTGVGHINLENAQFSGAGAISTAATKVTIGGTDDGVFANILSSTDIDDLTVTNQKVAVTAITNTVLDKLNVTTKDGGALGFVHTAANTCTELTVSGFDTVSITASGLVTATTAGTIKSLTLNGNTALASLNIGHTFSSKYTDAQLINIVNNDALKSVDLATVVRLENATITGNAILASILAPGITNLMTPGATLSYAVHSNKVTVTYKEAVAAVQDGINDTPYVEAKIISPSLLSWKNYLVAVSSVNSIVGTYNLNYDGENDNAAYTSNNTEFGVDRAADAVRIAHHVGGATPEVPAIPVWTGADIDLIGELLAIE